MARLLSLCYSSQTPRSVVCCKAMHQPLPVAAFDPLRGEGFTFNPKSLVNVDAYNA